MTSQRWGGGGGRGGGKQYWLRPNSTHSCSRKEHMLLQHMVGTLSHQRHAVFASSSGTYGLFSRPACGCVCTCLQLLVVGAARDMRQHQHPAVRDLAPIMFDLGVGGVAGAVAVLVSMCVCCEWAI